jgi:hypothetical protein
MMIDKKWFNYKYIDITLCEMVLTYLSNHKLEMIELVRHVKPFLKKHHKLAWRSFNTMNNVYHYYILHNDMLFDNAFLYFPQNSPDKVYNGIYHWAMVGNFMT